MSRQRLCITSLAAAAALLATTHAAAQGTVPAQHDIAAKWERNPSTGQYQTPKEQRPYVRSFDSAYYLATSKKSGQTTVRQARSPFDLRDRTKRVLTMMSTPTGVAQVSAPVDTATALHTTEMASTLWNGSYRRNEAGQVVRGPATPPMKVLPFLAKGVEAIQVRQGDYHNNIAPKFLITGLKGNAAGVAGLRVRLLLPTSAHDGGTIAGARQNALRYAQADKFRIWQTDPSSTGYAKRQLKTLADAIPSLGQLVTPVDLVVRLKQGELFQMQMDPLPGMTAGPGGFYSGRTAEFEWVDKSTFNQAFQQL